MKTKLQRAKRTLDNMKKREADALAAKAAAEEALATVKQRLEQVIADAKDVAVFVISDGLILWNALPQGSSHMCVPI